MCALGVYAGAATDNTQRSIVNTFLIGEFDHSSKPHVATYAHYDIRSVCKRTYLEREVLALQALAMTMAAAGVKPL